MRSCWEIANCGRDSSSCSVKQAGRSVWHHADGSGRCPWALAGGSAQAVQAAHEQELEALLEPARLGDEAAHKALVEEYGWHVARLARPFFLPGAEKEDLLQEGMMGLVQAIQTFDPSYGRSFLDHATLWIRNALLRAVRAATRKKHQMLSQAAQLVEFDQSATGTWDPTSMVDLRMAVEDLVGRLRNSLTELEYTSLMGRISGYTVKEIGAGQNVSVKQVENALFRARQKARRALEAS